MQRSRAETAKAHSGTAHTVKGVAGNLGIKGVQLAAEKLEKAIRENDAAVSSILKEFTSLLHPQIAIS